MRIRAPEKLEENHQPNISVIRKRIERRTHPSNVCLPRLLKLMRRVVSRDLLQPDRLRNGDLDILQNAREGL